MLTKLYYANHTGTHWAELTQAIEIAATTAQSLPPTPLRFGGYSSQAKTQSAKADFVIL
jgi:hypothetical protein